MSLFMTLCALVEPRTVGHFHSFLQKLIKTQNSAGRLTQFFTPGPTIQTSNEKYDVDAR